MTAEQRPLVPEFNGWAETTRALKEKYRSIGKKLYTFRNLLPDDFNDTVNVQDNRGNLGLRTISTTISHEDILRAPEEIQRVIYDLGLRDVNPINLSIVLGTSKDSEYDHKFEIILEPDEVTSEKLGLALTNYRNNRIIAPTQRVFDGIHQRVDSVFGKGLQMAELYEDDFQTRFGTVHPYMISILEAGENWVIEVLNSKRINPTPAETSTKGS